MNPWPAYRLRLFGSPTIEAADGAPLSGPVAQRHRLALLGLVALAPGQALSRDKLMAYLWPESDTDHARQLVNQSVYQLRKAMGEKVLLSGGDELRLDPAVVRTDVLEFQAAVGSGDHESAVGIYRGPFMDGFFLSDAPDFERWASQVREQLAISFAGSLEALADAAERRGDAGEAVSWWRTRAAQDPYDSRVALRLMKALEASGNPAGALQHSAVHQRLLEDDFGVEPDPAVAAMAERLRGEPGATLLAAPVDHLADAQPVHAGPRDAQPPVRSPVPDQPVAAFLAGSSRATARGTPTPARLAIRYGIMVMALGVVLVSAWQLRTRTPERASPIAADPSIAVLPFATPGSEPGDAELRDGITEDLITMLWKAGVRVIGSTSVSGFRDHQIDVRIIADSLGVAHIVEGSVQKVGSRVRVRARLVNGRDGSTLWSDTYDRELERLFAIQDEIARSVARELGMRPEGALDEPLVRQPTENIAAYELYLRGNDPALLRSDSAAREGLGYFRQAIALDSMYAGAWAGLGRMYFRVAGTVAAPDRPGVIGLGEDAALKAIELDEYLGEAHATLGLIRMAQFDFPAAEHHLGRAIELDPSRAQTHEWMVTLQLWTGRPDAALAHAERALELDPLSPTAHAELARALLGNDRCDEALELLEKLYALRPPLLRVAPTAAQCYARKGMWAEAIALLRPQAESGMSGALAQLGYMLARAGRTAEASDIRQTLLQHWRNDEGGAYHVALLEAGLGNLDETFVWLDRSLEDHSWLGLPKPVQLLILEPSFEELRRDPRFDRFRQRLGLQDP